MGGLLHNFMRGTVAGGHATEVAAKIDLSTYDSEDVLREQVRVSAKRGVDFSPIFHFCAIDRVLNRIAFLYSIRFSTGSYPNFGRKYYR